MTNRIEAALAEKGLTLPDTCTPRGNFLPYHREGNLVFMAGQICEWNGDVPFLGPVLTEAQQPETGIPSVNLEEGREAAQICALNLLFHLRAACEGDLTRVKTVLRVGGFVHCRFGFDQSPAVINGASDLFIDLYGDAGKHARTAVGVAGLPANASVEVDAVVVID